MLATIAAVGPHWGAGAASIPFLILIPLFWIAVIVVLVIVFSRRREWAARAGYGPWGWHGQQSSRSAETVLAERFAQGDIEEQEYRARLEVLRASAPQPPLPPTR